MIFFITSRRLQPASVVDSSRWMVTFRNPAADSWELDYPDRRCYNQGDFIHAVCQQIVRLGYEVKVGQQYSTEIDFVGTKGNEVVYVQAAYLITEEKTFNREFGNLMPIKDNYPKYVISMTPYMDSSKWEGIIHIPFADFLKNGFINK